MYDQDSSTVVAVPDVILCDASDLDFSQAGSVQASSPKDPQLQSQGWLWFNNLGVSNEVGNLLYQGETPLRAGRIRIFTADVSWRYGFSFSTAIKTPLGRTFPTDEAWRFPGLFRYGIVLFQRQTDQTLRAWTVREATAETPQEIEIDSGLDLYCGINDVKGKFGDNSGSFDLYLQVLA